MSDTYYVVGVHGVPTPETAPHGFGAKRSDGVLFTGWAPAVFTWTSGTQWWPLPPPPTEEAPPPEPVARWRPYQRGDCGWGLCPAIPGDKLNAAETIAAADALNALDRDGVAWGPGRPMSELPDGGAVLLLDDEGAFCVLPIETVRVWSVFVCWWPLPGEATT